MSGLHINLKPLPTTTALPVPEEEEYYSSWSLFLVCVLLVLSLLTSYYLQIKKIKTVHETLVSIFAGMAVGLIVRLAPGTMIREMLVSLPLHFAVCLCGCRRNVAMLFYGIRNCASEASILLYPRCDYHTDS